MRFYHALRHPILILQLKQQKQMFAGHSRPYIMVPDAAAGALH